MSYKDKYARLTEMRGSTIRERRENNTRLKLTRSFEDSLTWEEVHINGSIISSSVQIIEKGDDPFIKVMVMYPDETLKAGDVIDRNIRGYWLCVNTDPNSVYDKGDIYKCSISLNWIDELGQVFRYPAYLKSGYVSNTAVDVDVTMKVASARRLVKIRADENSLKIKKEDRFIFDGQSYFVADFDRKSEEGVMTIAFESSSDNVEDDNFDLEIANYYSKMKNSLLTMNVDSYMLMEPSTDYRLNIQILNSKNQEIKNPVLKYTYDPELLSIEDNVIKPLKIGSGEIVVSYGNLKKQISYDIANAQTHNYSVKISGADTIVVDREATYSCNFMDNGSIIDQNALFYIVDINDNPSNIATITSQDKISKTCKVKAGKVFGKEFYLQVRSESGLITGKKKIVTKSLF